MLFLGFEPRAARYYAQTDPLSYGSRLITFLPSNNNMKYLFAMFSSCLSIANSALPILLHTENVIINGLYFSLWVITKCNFNSF